MSPWCLCAYVCCLSAAASTSLVFVSRACAQKDNTRDYGIRKRVEAVKKCRGLTKKVSSEQRLGGQRRRRAERQTSIDRVRVRPARSVCSRVLVALLLFAAAAVAVSQDMFLNSSLPVMSVDPQTFRVTADGVHLTCKPATTLPLTNKLYGLF